ncbi:PEP-CTERM sorting domain-containing protein [Marinobacter subterrani]
MPEPSALILSCLGLIGFFLIKRRESWVSRVRDKGLGHIAK